MNRDKFVIDGKTPCKCPIVGKDRQCAKWYPSGKNALAEYEQFCRAETGFDDWPHQNKVWPQETAGVQQLRKGYVDRRKHAAKLPDTTKVDWGTVWMFAFIVALAATVAWVYFKE